MRPSFAMNDFGNSSAIDRIKLHDFVNCHLSGVVKLSNFFDVIAGKLGMAVLFTANCSAFVGTIAHVIELRAKEKMAWIYATSVVAFVKHAESFSLNFKVQLVRKAVRRAWLSIVVEVPVSVPSFASGPDPAFSKLWNVLRYWSVFIHLCPKPGQWINRRSRFSHSSQLYANYILLSTDYTLGKGFMAGGG